MSDSIYSSQTYGICPPQKLKKHIDAYLESEPARTYRLVIGTDSQVKNGTEVDFVTALIIHRVGSGGIYFWRRTVEHKQYALKQRMFAEAIHSLSAAEEFLTLFKSNGIRKIDLEIHVDVGTKGETREVITEIIGMVRSSGFTVKTKPDSFGASKVADRHTW